MNKISWDKQKKKTEEKMSLKTTCQKKRGITNKMGIKKKRRKNKEARV